MLAKYHDVMTKRDPFDDLWGAPESLFSPSLFGDLFSSFKHLNTETSMSRIEQTDSELIAHFDLPGVKPEDIEINASDDTLTISYVLRGHRRTKEYSLVKNYDTSGTTAKLEHGVLEIRVPRMIRAPNKKIAIEVK